MVKHLSSNGCQGSNPLFRNGAVSIIGKYGGLRNLCFAFNSRWDAGDFMFRIRYREEDETTLISFMHDSRKIKKELKAEAIKGIITLNNTLKVMLETILNISPLKVLK